jgi:hypothetical protein
MQRLNLAECAEETILWFNGHDGDYQQCVVEERNEQGEARRTPWSSTALESFVSHLDLSCHWTLKEMAQWRNSSSL